MKLITRRNLLALAGTSLAGAHLTGAAQPANLPAWDTLATKARGQTVYFNAWGGSDAINRYIQWAAAQVLQRHGVRVEHVKVSDAADVVKRVRNEKALTQSGSVDLVWINGENFAAMKREGLLHGPLNASLRHYALVDTVGKPTTLVDFAVPVDGMEVPWGMAQLTFMADSKRVPKPPNNVAELQAFAAANPGRVTYPRPPDFHGTTFLKQLLLDLNKDRAPLYQPHSQAAFASATPALWNYLDALHPHLWRKGRQFAASAAAMRQMLADGELLWALTFNPNEVANEIAAKRLSTSVVAYQFSGGTIGNTHFVAVPFNARAKEGAILFADFLLSPEAQARKADIGVWGDPTVLDTQRLPAAEQALFNARPAPGQVVQSAPAIPEPHASWVAPLEQAWLQRYGT
jgi:putative thiamine transport system substrate-binding protein